jgi:hypothetical protein
MPQALTLCEFLEDTGAELRFYDMGRRVAAIAREDFLAFERTDRPYPLPMQQKAWFALVQRRTAGAGEPVIWFLRFDLDEQAKLVQATRDYFIHRFAELAGATQGDTDLAQALDDNPFTFKPREDKLANLNAVLKRELGQAPSPYFEHARDYFAGRLGWDQWKFVGYQGIADIAARHAEPPVLRLLTQAIPKLPDEPLVALCQCLENHCVADDLGQALRDRVATAINRNDSSAALLAALLRGLSQASGRLLKGALSEVLRHPAASDAEVVAAIAGRAWEALQDERMARAYLEHLASPAVDQQIFNHCVADLLHMPQMQASILQVLRSQQRSPHLEGAFQAMLQGKA